MERLSACQKAQRVGNVHIVCLPVRRLAGRKLPDADVSRSQKHCLGKWLWLSKPFSDPIWVGEFTTHFRTDFHGDWDVHWGYGSC